MHDKGIKLITYPITSKDGLYVQLDNTLIVLFNFIPAEQSYDYNMYEFGKLTATIHVQEVLNSTSNNSVEKNYLFFPCMIP